MEALVHLIYAGLHFFQIFKDFFNPPTRLICVLLNIGVNREFRTLGERELRQIRGDGRPPPQEEARIGAARGQHAGGGDGGLPGDGAAELAAAHLLHEVEVGGARQEVLGAGTTVSKKLGIFK